MEIDQELLDVFSAEADETLRSMEEALMSLEALGNDAATMQLILRGAHTLKGNAACVGFDELAGAAHRYEDLLAQVRDGVVPVSAELVSELLVGVDAFRRGVQRCLSGNTQLPAEDHAIFERIVARAQAAGEQSASARKMSLSKMAALTAPTGAPHTPTQRMSQSKMAAVTAAVPIATTTPSASAAQSVETAPPAPAPKAAAVSTKAAESAPEASAGRTLRIATERLDSMLDLIGELAISRSRLRELVRGVGGDQGEQLVDAYANLERLSLLLQDQVMRTRMVPVGPLFRQFRRVVREASGNIGKNVALVLEGEDVEVDTTIVELLKDPLTHMVRNAIDHGLERSERRRECGKPEQGQLTLRATHEAGNIIVQIIDDGQGLNVQRIKDKAKARGLVADPDALSLQDVFQLIFLPGFSTAEAVTELSGRGVGMDVVRKNVEALRGSLTVDSISGQGATITIKLPLTLAIIDGFAVGVGDETYVVPLDDVRECLDFPAVVEGRGASVVSVRGEPLPCVCLREFFGASGHAGKRQSVVVVEQQSKRFGLVVDALHGETQVVIKPLSRLFQDIPGLSASAVLGTGTVALILDVPTLLEETTQRAHNLNKRLIRRLSGEFRHVS